MLMQPLRPNASRNQVAAVRSIAAPTRGWNTRDSLADMDRGYAVILDNYFPDGGSCKLRGGTERHATITSATDPVESLMVYSSGTASKMIAACNGSLYDATSAGALSSTLATGLTNDRWSYDHMGGYIVMVNGADTPRKYDGSSVTTTTITGVTATNLIYVKQSKGRLFFIEKDSLSVWYLGVGAIAGAATEIDFSSYCKLGGKMVAIGVWTRDGGNGADDLTCFFTDQGEVLVYQGTDPASASTWAQIGVFRIGSPIGNRPLITIGGDLVVITENGYVPLSRVLPEGRTGRTSLSDAIDPEVSKQARIHRAKFGWEAILYPNGRYALFNVPTNEGLAAEQHVVNTKTGAWCRFKDIDAVCWALLDDELYFGGANGFIVKADTDDYKDDTLATSQAFSVIQGDLMPAYDYFGNPAQSKLFSLCRPVISSNGVPDVSVALNVDFERRTPTPVDTAASSGTPWGSPWGSPWSSGINVQRNWLSTIGIGYNAALHIRTRTSGIEVEVNSIDYEFQRGQVL